MKYKVDIIKATEQITKAENQTSVTAEEEYAAGEWIAPEQDLRGLEALVNNSSILPQCIRAYRGNIAGFGIAIKYIDDEKETGDKAEEFTRAETILRRLNFDKDISEVFADIIEARETYGTAYVEVIRTMEGEVSQIVFIEDTPSIEKTAPLYPYVDIEIYDRGEKVQTRKRFRKYKQQVGGTTVYFREFGDPRRMDMRSGKYLEDTEELDAEYEANEILEFPIGTKPYGKVRWLGQVLGIDGSRRAEVLNNNYFINGRHTPMMIVLRGGSLTDESFEKLTQYMNDIKGEAGQHAFIVLETENTDARADFDAVERPEVEIKDMASMLQKDELFQGYLENNRRRVQSSFLLPDIYVGFSTDFNRATAQAAIEVTEQQVFQPERNSLAWIVNNKLLNDYNFKHVEAYFRSPDLNNPEDLVQLLSICNAAGGLTPNKAKSILFDALGEVSEDYEGDWANQPLALASNGAAGEAGGQQQYTPEVDKQLGEQIQKAAAAHEDEIVAILKEVRNLLKSSKKGLTTTLEGDIIEKEWEEDKHPRDDNGRFVSSGDANSIPAQSVANRIETAKIIERGRKAKTAIFATGKLARNGANIKPEKNKYDIIMHGDEKTVEFFGKRINAYTLAEIIKGRNDYSEGTPIRLLSCKTGSIENTGNCFAQMLANILNVDVYAPTDTLWVFSNGSISIGANKGDNSGTMKRFYSRNYRR